MTRETARPRPRAFAPASPAPKATRDPLYVAREALAALNEAQRATLASEGWLSDPTQKPKVTK